jgi:tetratricopeptide (TPR) repeat protein
MTVLCQTCGAPNPDGAEHCARCHAKLLVVSGQTEDPDLSDELFLQQQEEFDEHLLERISALEKSVTQLAEALAAADERVEQLEHQLTLTHAGVEALGELLETQDVVSRTEFANGWERAVDRHMLSRDLVQRFRDRAQRIASHAAHTGHASDEFQRSLRALELALASQQTGPAFEQMTQLARLAPDNDELWRFIGEAAFEIGDLDTARISFTRVLELRGPHFETLIYLGTTLSDLERWEEAEMVLHRARELAPDSFLPLFTLGALYTVCERHEEAIDYLQQAAEIEELPQTLYLLGISHLALAHTGRAIDALRAALEISPEFEDALYQLGTAYLKRGWTRRALSTFHELAELDPQRLHYRETARLLSLELPEHLPPEARRLVERAEVMLERGDGQAALDLFGSALAIGPEQPGLIATLALLASSIGRARDAVAYAHRLLRADPQESPYRAAAAVALLEALRHARRLKVAQRCGRALYTSSSDALLRGLVAYELSLIESDLGEDLNDARELARDALETTPRELRHYPLAALGEIAMRRGRFREAVQYLEQATASAPLPVLLRQLAIARLGAGDSSGAQEALDAAHGSEGGLDEELLGHVRRLGHLVESVKGRQRQARSGG